MFSQSRLLDLYKKIEKVIVQGTTHLTRKTFLLTQVVGFVLFYLLLTMPSPITKALAFLIVIGLTFLSAIRSKQLHIPRLFALVGWIPLVFTPLISFFFIKHNIDIVQSYIDKGVSAGSNPLSTCIPLEAISTYLFPPMDESLLTFVLYGIVATLVISAISYFGILLANSTFFQEKGSWKRKLLLLPLFCMVICTCLCSCFTVQISNIATSGFERVGKTFTEQDDSFSTDDIKDKIIPTVSFLSEKSYENNQAMEDSIQNQMELFYKLADGKGLCFVQMLKYKNDSTNTAYPNNKYGIFIGPVCAANQTNGEHLLAMPTSSIETQPVSLYLIKAVVNGKETAVNKTVEIKPQMNVVFFNTDENISVGDNIQLYIGRDKDTVETVVYSTLAN